VIVNVNPEEMHVIVNVNAINVTNFGRAMAYLTLIYLMHDSEDVTRRAVRLVTAIDSLYTLDSASLLLNLKPRIFQRLPPF
jgi:hypothetical protein